MVLGLLWDLLVGVPATLSKEVLRSIMDEIDRERLLSEESIRRKLQELQMMLACGELSEAEYERQEEELIRRLKALREKE